MAAGIAGVAWTVKAAAMSLTTWDLIPSYTVCGVGMGLLIACYFTTVISAVDDEETGTAGGVLNAVQQLASSLGVALFGTLYFNSLTAGHTSVSATASTLWFASIAVVLCFPLGFLLPRFPRADIEMH
jgi:MFS family permease